MKILDQFLLLLQISRSHEIGRRYFVVNGFDGALTMLGIIIGFYHLGTAGMEVVIGACLGAAIALGISGISSAYISEEAERSKGLRDLERAMVTDLADSAHARAARLVPITIALINGLAPFVISMLIMIPLWFPALSDHLPVTALELAILFSLAVIFLLGVFLGSVSGRFWLLAGLRALLIALLTAGIIFLVTPD